VPSVASFEDEYNRCGGMEAKVIPNVITVLFSIRQVQKHSETACYTIFHIILSAYLFRCLKFGNFFG